MGERIRPHETIEWLYGLQHFGVKLGLDAIRALLDSLGRPDRAYRIVHVAGTNGKGSVAVMVDAMLGASGVRSGLYTSPHLVRPNERIRVAGRDVEDAELHALLAELRRRIGDAVGAGTLAAHPSFFEVVTATALEAFRRAGLRAAVLEVGLGGRLDATNAVESDVSAIVSVGLDHTKTLGGTIEAIAAEKAGIVKPGVPLVCGVVQQRAREVVERICREREAPFVDARVHVRLEADDGETLAFRTARRTYPGLRLSLAGRHQIDNARVALAAFELVAERLGFAPDPAAVREGLASARWRGRLEWIAGRPPLMLDAAHNPDGMATFVRYLEANPPPSPVLLFGATHGRPIEELLAPLAPFASRVVLTRPPVDKAVDPEEIAPIAREHFADTRIAEAVGDALEAARALAGPQGSVIVTGSLYLVGEVIGLVTGEATPGAVAL